MVREHKEETSGVVLQTHQAFALENPDLFDRVEELYKQVHEAKYQFDNASTAITQGNDDDTLWYVRVPRVRQQRELRERHDCLREQYSQAWHELYEPLYLHMLDQDPANTWHLLHDRALHLHKPFIIKMLESDLKEVFPDSFIRSIQSTTGGRSFIRYASKELLESLDFIEEAIEVIGQAVLLSTVARETLVLYPGVLKKLFLHSDDPEYSCLLQEYVALFSPFLDESLIVKAILGSSNVTSLLRICFASVKCNRWTKDVSLAVVSRGWVGIIASALVFQYVRGMVRGLQKRLDCHERFMTWLLVDHRCNLVPPGKETKGTLNKSIGAFLGPYHVILTDERLGKIRDALATLKSFRY